MKKFYEAPVVELTGFSAEDVITTSVVVNPTTVDTLNLTKDEVKAAITGYDAYNQYNAGSYEW